MIYLIEELAHVLLHKVRSAEKSKDECSVACTGMKSSINSISMYNTPPRIDLLCMKNWDTQWTIEISSNESSALMAIEKIKIVGAVLELPAKQNSIANSANLAHFAGGSTES